MSAREDLLKLILEVSFEKRKVTLTSGRESDFYLDLRQTLMRPRGARLAGLLALEKLLGGPPVESVGGMAVGAVPFVSAILLAAAERDPETDLLGFFVRKEAKKHGLGRRIEGGFQAGQTVALVEDTTTTDTGDLDLDHQTIGQLLAHRHPLDPRIGAQEILDVRQRKSQKVTTA